MNTKTTVAAVLTALLLATGATPTRLLAADTTGDDASLRKNVADFIAAWNRHDAKAMAATFADDADVINPFGRVAKGRAEIEKLLGEEHATMMRGTTYAATAVDIRLLGPAVAVSEWSSEITNMHDPAGKSLPPFKHHVVVVHMKRNGQWWPLIVRPHAYLTPPPPPTGKSG